MRKWWKPSTWSERARGAGLTVLAGLCIIATVGAIGRTTLVNDYLSRMTVTITGGRAIVTAIDNIAIGGTTPAAVAATTLSASGATALSTTLAVTGATTLSAAWIGGTETVTLSSADPGIGTSTTAMFWSAIVSHTDGSATDTCSVLDGTVGQIKFFTLKTDGEATGMALTPVNFGPGVDLLFETVDDSCILIFDGVNWQIILNNGGTLR